MKKEKEMLMAVCRKKGSDQNIFIVFEKGTKPDIPKDCEAFAFDVNKVQDWDQYKPGNVITNTIKNWFSGVTKNEDSEVAATEETQPEEPQLSEEEKEALKKKRNSQAPLIRR